MFRLSSITPATAAFLEGPNSIMVASHDAELVPEIARAVSLRCAPDGERVTVILPTPAGRDVIKQLEADPRIAIVCELSATHQTLQLKGRVLSMRPTREDERPAIEASVGAFFAALEQIGVPRRLTERLVRWPATSIEVQVEQLFEQSPGPGAGDPFHPTKSPVTRSPAWPAPAKPGTGSP
jgi:hypothetical protein